MLTVMPVVIDPWSTFLGLVCGTGFGAYVLGRIRGVLTWEG